MEMAPKPPSPIPEAGFAMPLAKSPKAQRTNHVGVLRIPSRLMKTFHVTYCISTWAQDKTDEDRLLGGGKALGRPSLEQPMPANLQRHEGYFKQ